MRKIKGIVHLIADCSYSLLPTLTRPNTERKILFIGEYFPARIQRLVKYLKKCRKEELVLYISDWGYEPKLIGPYFDRIVVYRNKFDLKRLLKAEQNIRVVHAFEPKAEFQYHALRLIKAPFIYDLQDIIVTYYNNSPPLKWQKVNLKYEHLIFNSKVHFIAQSLELNEAMRLHHVNRKSSTRLFFPLYCDADNFKPIKGKTISPPYKLVYIGGINRTNEHYSSNFLPFIQSTANPNILFDLFPSPSSEKTCYDEYKQLEGSYPHFRMKRSVPFNQLNLTEYDFGVVPFEHNYSEHYYTKNRYASTLKFFVYLEMGIPILISDYWAFPAWIVQRYGLGIVTKFGNLHELESQIRDLDYNKTLENIEKFRNRFELSKNIKRLSDFYDTLSSD